MNFVLKVTWKKWGVPEELLILYVKRPCYYIGIEPQCDIFTNHERRKYYQFTKIKFRSNVYTKYVIQSFENYSNIQSHTTHTTHTFTYIIKLSTISCNHTHSYPVICDLTIFFSFHRFLQASSTTRKPIEHSQNPLDSNIFCTLSLEILVLIFKFLRPKDIMTFASVSRECYHFANSEVVWKDVCLRSFVPTYLKSYDLNKTNETWKEFYFNHQNFLRLVVQPPVDGCNFEYLFLELKIGNFYKIVKAISRV
jgi:hypothetical protein